MYALTLTAYRKNDFRRLQIKYIYLIFFKISHITVNILQHGGGGVPIEKESGL